MKLFLLFALFNVSWGWSRFTRVRNVEPCPETMVRFAGENSSETFCDCRETFLYYPDDKLCYDAFRQGPCPSEQYLVLPPGETAAKCEKNPCLLDGLVPFQDECYLLWKSSSPCENEFERLTVNLYSFEIECDTASYIGDYSNLETSKSCPKNSMLVPKNENETEWICECRRGFLRDPKTENCYEPFRQGPCSSEEFFTLPPDDDEAKCEKNSCLKDGLVPFEGSCHPLKEFGPPCGSFFYYLGVDEENFQLKCIYSSKKRQGGHHAGGIITAPSKSCRPGSRRVATAGCKHVFQ